MIDCKLCFQEFHPGRFVVFSALLLFGVMLSFRLDNLIECSWWIIFAPLWIWKVFVIGGVFVGVHSYYRKQAEMNEVGSTNDFQAMLLSAALQILLLGFELCLCYKLSFDATQMTWYIVFLPLFLLSVLSVIVCGWGWRKERTLDLELLFAVNMLQFVMLVLRLERLVLWSWQIILIPLWVLLGICSVGVVYYIALTAVLLCTNDILPSLRTPRTAASLLFSLTNFSTILFLGLLIGKLDNYPNSSSYVVLFLPYHISMGSMIISSFYQRGGNPWWFGIREEFCVFLLKKCPKMRVYGNISYACVEDEEMRVTSVSTLSNARSDSKHSLPNITFSNLELPD